MKRFTLLCRTSLILLWPFSVATLAAPALIVVEDRGGVSAHPYYEALDLQPDTPSSPAASSSLPRQKPFEEADMLPVRSKRLTPGTVTPRAIQAAGLTPLFVIGDDPRSHAWLQQHRDRLIRLQATGLVVQVETAAALAALRRQVPDLTLAPVSGDELAQRLGLRHYPALITATGIEP